MKWKPINSLPLPDKFIGLLEDQSVHIFFKKVDNDDRFYSAGWEFSTNIAYASIEGSTVTASSKKPYAAIKVLTHWIELPKIEHEY